MIRRPFLFIIILLCAAGPVCGDEWEKPLRPPTDKELYPQNGQQPPPGKKPAPEFVWELDPYYTEVSLHIPLTYTPIPELSEPSELYVYRKLLLGSLMPRYLLLEAAVFPMPLIGVALKEYQRDFYRGFNIGSGTVNLIEAITAGFQEPYAISAFLGDMVSFIHPGQEKISSNKGYMGYLISYSNQHIKRNTLVPDHNLEIEWKTKGERFFVDEKLSWSFRLGSKLHENPYIADTLYLGFRRSSLDFMAGMMSFLKNSSIDFRWDFSVKDGRLLRQEYVIGTKIPIKSWHMAFRLDAGMIWEDQAKYKGRLKDRSAPDFTAVLRPNLEF